jgi:hypothetical protein
MRTRPISERRAVARHRAFRLLEVLFKHAGMRLLVAKRDFRKAKVHCDQPSIQQAIIDTQNAADECSRISRRVKALGIRRRVT